MEASTVKVTIKISGKGEQFEFNLDPQHSVDQVLDQIAQQNPKFLRDRMTLVRKGRILKKDQVIQDVGVTEGETLQLVDKATAEDNKEEKEDAQPNALPGFPGFPGFPGMPGMGGMGGIPGMGIPNMEMGMPGQGGMPAMFNPEMMANILNNPMVKSMISDMFSDPEKIKQVLKANPFLSEMAEGNEEIRKLMSNL